MADAVWKLEDAKARFSEVVRRARSEGPQRVTVRGRDAVVVISAEEMARLTPPVSAPRTGADLLAAMRGNSLWELGVPERSMDTGREIELFDDEAPDAAP